MREGREDSILPPAEEKPGRVRRMFGEIAPRYDLLNHLLTLGIDRRWRRRAVDRLLEGRTGDGFYLDACAGTMDLTAELAGRPGFEGTVLAADFALPMLEAGRRKVRSLPVLETVADALCLPHEGGTFQGVIAGFGVRNFADLDAGLRELTRVLRPGGRLVILELSTPAWPPLRRVYNLYFTRVLPWIGRWVSGHDTAYRYLPESVGEFPGPEELATRMRDAGLTDVRFRRLMAGIAAIHEGVRG